MEFEMKRRADRMLTPAEVRRAMCDADMCLIYAQGDEGGRQAVLITEYRFMVLKNLGI